MTIEEKLERVTDNLDRLTQVVGTLADTTAHHGTQIEALISIAERHDTQIQTLVREWQAYLRTIRPQ